MTTKANDTAEAGKAPRQRLLLGLVILLALLGLLVIVLDWKEIRQVLTQANWALVPVALLFAGLSYLCMSFAYAVANRIFDVAMPLGELALIGFVSQVLNHLLSSGGAAGYSVRFLTMGRKGVSAQDILAASFFHFYFTSLGMLALLPAGLFYVFARHPLSPGLTRAVGLGAVLLVMIFILGTLVVFVQPVRGWIMRLISRAAAKVTRRNVQVPLDEFEATVARGVSASRQHPAQLLVMLVLVTADWTFSLVAMYFCFDALGDPLKLGVLTTGYAIGVLAGVLSMIPGGLGVQEGSMAGIYALLGVPLQTAILAAILFRVVYYFIPYLVSLGLYRRILARTPGPTA